MRATAVQNKRPRRPLGNQSFHEQVREGCDIKGASDAREQWNGVKGTLDNPMENATAPNDITKLGFAPPFDVRVLRSAIDYNRFWWLVRGADGRIVASSPRTYSSEAEARAAADAEIRPLLKRRAS